MSDQDILAEIRALHEKLDRIIALLEASKANTPKSRSRPRSPKPKPVPLTEVEIRDLQLQFDNIFSRWLDGHELEVQDELEKLDVDQLRRFADANNLNITAKMPKQRVLQLIGARFREKRQLHKGTSSLAEGKGGTG